MIPTGSEDVPLSKDRAKRWYSESRLDEKAARGHTFEPSKARRFDSLDERWYRNKNQRALKNFDFTRSGSTGGFGTGKAG